MFPGPRAPHQELDTFYVIIRAPLYPREVHGCYHLRKLKRYMPWMRSAETMEEGVPAGAAVADGTKVERATGGELQLGRGRGRRRRMERLPVVHRSRGRLQVLSIPDTPKKTTDGLAECFDGKDFDA